MRSFLITGSFLCCTAIPVAAQDPIDGRDQWMVTCDTAGTDLGTVLCICAQRDTAASAMHTAYERIMLALNKQLAALRAQTIPDSAEITHIDRSRLAVQQAQEAWLTFKDASLELTHTLGEQAAWHGDLCITELELLKNRISELEEVLFGLQEGP